MADIKIAYAASSNLTVTNLHSLASSSTFVGCWESGAIDNTSNLYLDYRVTGKIIVGNSATDGQIRVYVVDQLDDSTWPDVLDGTESTETWTDTEIRDGVAKLAAVVEVDADGGTDDTYYFSFKVAPLYGGLCPSKFVIVISHSTGVALAAASNQVTIKGEYLTTA